MTTDSYIRDRGPILRASQALICATASGASPAAGPRLAPFGVSVLPAHGGDDCRHLKRNRVLLSRRTFRPVHVLDDHGLVGHSETRRVSIGTKRPPLLKGAQAPTVSAVTQTRSGCMPKIR